MDGFCVGGGVLQGRGRPDGSYSTKIYFQPVSVCSSQKRLDSHGESFILHLSLSPCEMSFEILCRNHFNGDLQPQSFESIFSALH